MIKNFEKYNLLFEEFERLDPFNRNIFKVGDIVKVKKGSIVSGKIGTVVGIPSPYGNYYSVEFDDWFEGHECRGQAKPRQGWELMWYELELVENGEESGKIRWYGKGKLIKETVNIKNIKVGDRVQSDVKNSKLSKGLRGTVVLIQPTSVSVEWDEFVNGHNCNGYAKEGCGWNVYPKEISLVEDDEGRIRWYSKGMITSEKISFKEINVGNKVIYDGEFSDKLHKGDTGTVVGMGSGIVLVEWDRFVYGHDCNGKAKKGHGWNVVPIEISIVEDNGKTRWYSKGKLVKEGKLVATENVLKKEFLKDKTIEEIVDILNSEYTGWVKVIPNLSSYVMFVDKWEKYGDYITLRYKGYYVISTGYLKLFGPSSTNICNVKQCIFTKYENVSEIRITEDDPYGEEDWLE